MSPDFRTDATLQARSCLVLGGARSGKSSYAQRIVERSGRQPVLIATATAWDQEMRDRVARHRRERDARWTTVEEPIALTEALSRLDRPDAALLVDCLTLWLSNLMLGGHDHETASGRLVAALPPLKAHVVFVSNEVGSGIVPDTPLGRAFRDAQGRLNQSIATACDAVVQVVAGLPVLLKPSRYPEIML